mmetsp:Transcript_9/g.17  ORF Transcript_9/g.17 Transcript_9/m.17 type:complete len:292 (+) Transcript_9:13-888(+)
MGEGFGEKLDEAKEVRNRNMGCLKRTIFISSILLIIAGISIVAKGGKFLKIDIMGKDESAENDVFFLKEVIMSGILLFSVLVILISTCGMCIVRKESTGNCIVFIYGSLIFFGGFLPMISQSTLVLSVNNVSKENIDMMCLLGARNSQNNSDSEDQEGMNRFLYALADLAHRYDQRTEQILDQNMCTDTCLCYADEYYTYDQEGYRDEMVDPTTAYRELPEEEYIKRERSFTYMSEGYTKYDYEYFKWSARKNGSFFNFAECYDDWEARAREDSSINLKEVFNLDFDPPQR